MLELMISSWSTTAHIGEADGCTVNVVHSNCPDREGATVLAVVGEL